MDLVNTKYDIKKSKENTTLGQRIHSVVLVVISIA